MRIPLYVILTAGLAIAGWMVACRPDTTSTNLGPRPAAAISVTPVAGKTNTYLLSGTTVGAFLWKWDIGDGSTPTLGTSTDTAYYPQKGTYRVSLVIAGRGGYDTTSQQIVVAADDSNGCFGAKQQLTACTSRTWVLAPEAGAMAIGSPGLAQTWWSNGAGDVTARACQFNDEYTFKKDGTFLFDNKGDMWVDNDNGTDPFPADILNGSGQKSGCYPWSSINPVYAAWGSGSHRFKVVGSTLTVQGTGAFMGLYKVGDNNTTPVPDSQVSYQIVSITDTRLVIRKNYSWGTWQFTFVAK